MNAAPGAAVPIFSSLNSPARPVSPNAALCRSLHRLPSPTFLKNLNLGACRYKSRSRRRIAEDKTSSLEKLGYGREGAEGLRLTSRRNVAPSFGREESSSRAAYESRNHEIDKAKSYNKGKDFLPSEEQKHHVSSVGKKHPRVPLPTKNQHLRMHNKVTVFEGIRQPTISVLSPNNLADASSWGVEDADVAPSDFKGQGVISYEDSRHRLKRSQCSTQREIKENIQTSSNFMSKLEEVLSNLKKKDDVLSENLAIKEQILRDENTCTHSGQGFQTATTEGKRTKENTGLGSLQWSEMQSVKSGDSDIESSVRDANVTCARYDSRTSPLMNDGNTLQCGHDDAKSLLNENVKGDNDAQVMSFNLFSSSPSVPWEADRNYASTFENLMPIRGVNLSPLAQRSFRSIGSRSCPSRRSVNNRNVGRLKLSPHTATDVVELPKLIGSDEQIESLFENREGIKMNDDKLTTQVAGVVDSSKLIQRDEQIESSFENRESIELNDEAFTTEVASNKGAQKAEQQVESINFRLSESNTEYIEENGLSMHLNIEEAGIEANAHTNSGLVAQSSQESPVDTILDASKMDKCSNDSKFPSWHRHNLPDIPFGFQFSYSEAPKAPILGYRETPYSPFGPFTMGRPWTGRQPPKPSKKRQWVFDSFNPPPKDKKGVKYVQDPGPYPEGQVPKPAKSREEIMGEQLTKEEIIYLVEKCERESRQINLGRDGLTHNMLDLIHCHWKRRRVCKIKCKGVPTVDMDNVKFHIEDKTGGKVIYQAGGVLYLFRGRNYNYKDRPQIPLMLWKPATPLYPKLIQPAPEGLTEEEARRLRVLGRKVQPMCRLGKNGVYSNLVKDVRAAFEVDELVSIDCRGLNPSDYKKIGAKLKDLVPCVLLSFDKEHILMWKGKQDLSAENRNLSSCPKLEQDEEILKQSSRADEGDGQSLCEEKVNNLVDETSYLAHASGGETEEKMHQSHSKQESGSMLDYASQEALTHSCDTDYNSVRHIAEGQEQFHMTKIDKTHFSSSITDEDQALSGTRKANYASNSQSLKEENVNVSLENIPFVDDEVCLYTADSLSERHATAERNLQQNTGGEGPNTSFEESDESVNSKVAVEGHKELVPLEAAPSENTLELEDGLTSDEGVLKGCFDNQSDSIVRLDELWDHAFSSGMAVELSEEDMDADMIVRKAAQLAKVAPLGPTYTIKLSYKLRLKRDEIRPNDILDIRFGRGKPRKIPKKGVKRKFQLPTLDVPGMGGLPVDELARLLAPKQAP